MRLLVLKVSAVVMGILGLAEQLCRFVLFLMGTSSYLLYLLESYLLFLIFLLSYSPEGTMPFACPFPFPKDILGEKKNAFEI